MYGKTVPDNIPKSGDSFDDMFSFEATLKDRLTPDQLDQIEREELAKKFGSGSEWLSRPEQRAEYQTASHAEQLQSAFAHLEGYKGSELSRLYRHLRGDLGKSLPNDGKEKGR